VATLAWVAALLGAGVPASSGMVRATRLADATRAGTGPAARVASDFLASTTVEPGVRSRLPSRRVPGSFLGFSIEYNSVLDYTGSYVPGLDAPFAAVVSRLGAFGGGLPSLRFGGVSTDESWWDPNGKPAPSGIHISLNPYWVNGVGSFEQAERTPLIFGLNLGQPSTSYALNWAKEATTAFGRRVTFEYGNEPDLYGMSFPFINAEGKRAYTTPLRRDWSFAAYIKEFTKKATLLHKHVRGIRLAGPSPITFAWDSLIPEFVRDEHTRVSMATAHVYPMCTCVTNPDETSYPSLAHILSATNVFAPLTELAPAINSARSHHLGFRVSEAGIISGGGGRLGGSFAGALWGLDFMFTLAEAGGSGVNFHTSGTYTPVSIGYVGALGSGGHWVMSAHPLLYAMLMFAQATGDGARLLPDSTFLDSARRAGANILMWATVDRSRTVHVVVVNEDQHDAGQIRIRIPSGRGAGSLIRLTAPSPGSTAGTTLAGQSYAPASSDGQLQGAYLSARVGRASGGVYTFSMPTTSAALLTVNTK